MRISLVGTLSLAAALMLAPRTGSTQVSVDIHLGAPIPVVYYEPAYFGDWRVVYMDWTPVTLYYFEDRWYPRPMRGARMVVVYRNRGGEYFLPPRDHDWKDSRYNYRYRPMDIDYERVGPPKGRGRGRGRGHGKH